MTFRSSDIFEKFLKIEDKREFEAAKKEIRKRHEPKTVKDIKLIQGRFDNEINMDKLKMCKNIPNYINEQILLHQQLIESTETTSKIVNMLSNSLAKDAEIFNKISKSNTMMEVV